MAEDIQEITDDSFFIPGFKDANSYTQKALFSILTATKSSNELPAPGDDFTYYSCFPGFQNFTFHKRQAIVQLMTSIIHSHGIREKFEGRASEEKFDLLSEANDVILESVSNYLDEASGLKKSEEELVLAVKPSSAINTSWNKKQFNSPNQQSYKLLAAKNISRPQLSFKNKTDNSNTAFVPIIKEKPNSIKPLAIMLENDGEREEFCHPYEWEIEKFAPLEEHLQAVEPELPKPLDETPFEMIKTEEQLKKLYDDLKTVKEFAVDLEHHAYRSFQGFTCLMQISTREKDYIIDTLELRSEMWILNEVFTDPKIVKVLHGADMDVLWLQRDFGIYIVNLFDTGQAARVLHFAHLSLAYLLKHYCKLDIDKRFQLADWRIRPLPAEMIKYAREDTHYLLYVYDSIKNDLIKSGNEMKNLLSSTFDRSKVICAKKYQKPLFTDDKYLELYKKSKKMLNAKQLYCLKELYEWRDRIARENDESIAYVLPNHMILQIAETLPKEQQGILACCNPIPPLVKQQLNELHTIVLKANESSLNQLQALDLQQKTQAPKIVYNHIDLSSLVHCPHDIHHLEDKEAQSGNQSGNAENLLPLITKQHTTTSSLLKKKPILSALFEKSPQKLKSSDNMLKIPEKVVDSIKKLISPFERYKVTEQMQSENSPKKKEKKNLENKGNKKSESKTSTSQNFDVEIDNEEENKISEDENDSANVLDDSCIIEEEISKETLTEKGNAVRDTSVASTSKVTESTPLRKKKRGKKKKRKAEPDVSLIGNPECNYPPPSKKPCSPEVVTIADDSFTPYDYSKSDYSDFTGKKKGKSARGRSFEQTPRSNFHRKKKHGKQGTFSKESTNNHNSKWPKNK